MSVYGARGFSRGMGSTFGNLANYHRIPSNRQHPIRGAYAASVLNDHADVVYHVKQSFHNGVQAGMRRRGFSGYRGGFQTRRYSGRQYGYGGFQRRYGSFGRPQNIYRSQYARY